MGRTLEEALLGIEMGPDGGCGGAGCEIPIMRSRRASQTRFAQDVLDRGFILPRLSVGLKYYYFVLTIPVFNTTAIGIISTILFNCLGSAESLGTRTNQTTAAIPQSVSLLPQYCSRSQSV